MKRILSTLRLKQAAGRLSAIALTICLVMSSLSASAVAPSFRRGASVDTTFCNASTINLNALLAVDDPDGGSLVWSFVDSTIHSRSTVSPTLFGTSTTPVVVASATDLTPVPSMGVNYTSFYDTINLRYRVFDGTDADTISIRLIINPRPSVSVISGVPELLYNEVFNYTSNATPIHSTLTSTWSVFTSPISGVATIDPVTGRLTAGTTTGSATVTLTYVSTAGCVPSASASYTLSVLPNSAPTITGVSPTVVVPGNTVTISGTNFNATASNNTVFFGPVKATPSSATTTQLIVTVPKGATNDNISVINTATKLSTTSTKSFIPTFDATPFIPSTYNNLLASTDIRLPWNGLPLTLDSNGHTKPYSIELGDLDNDGKLDIVVSGTGDDSVYIYRNIGTAGKLDSTSFSSTPIILRSPAKPINLKIADFDRDGKLDIATACAGAGVVAIWRNTTSGSISFSPFVDLTVGVLPIELAVSDINKDGRPDLAVCLNGGATLGYSEYRGMVAVIRSIASPGVAFTRQSFAIDTIYTYPATHKPTSIAVGDIDQNGMPDIVVSNHRTVGDVRVFRNTTTAGTPGTTPLSFDAPTVYNTEDGASNPTSPNQLRLADLNNDGLPEMIVAVSDSDLATLSSPTPYSKVHVYPNTSTLGSTTFGSVQYVGTGAPNTSAALGLAVADMNADGKPDVIVTNAKGGSYSLLLNNSTATPSLATGEEKIMYHTSRASGVIATTGAYALSAPVSVAIGDLDGAGNTVQDIAIVHRDGNYISLIKNQPIPDTNSIRGRDTVCVGATTIFTSATRAGAASYWKSSDPAIATVTAAAGSTADFSDTTATITGVSAGTATITCFVVALNDTNYVTRVVNVYANPAAGTLSGTSPIVAGTTSTVTRTGGDAGGTWVSANTAVATITGTTATTATALGQLVLTATTTEIKYFVTSNVGCPTDTARFNLTVTPAAVPPAVASFTPNAVIPGTTVVTINAAAGTSFSPVRSNNIVRFGATVADTTTMTVAADGSSMTVIVPRGALQDKLFIVNRETGLSTVADYKQTPVFDTTAFYDSTITALRPSFDIKLPWAGGSDLGLSAYAVEMGDMDGDGFTDMVVGGIQRDTLYVYRNIGVRGQLSATSFAPPIALHSFGKPINIKLADMNNDGKLDIVSAGNYNDRISVYPNNATPGSLTTASFGTEFYVALQPVSDGPIELSIADLNNDGKADIVYTSKFGLYPGPIVYNFAVGYVKNNSTPTSMSSATFTKDTIVTYADPLANLPISVTTGDVNNDGKADVIVSHHAGTRRLSVYLNTTADMISPITFDAEQNLFTADGSTGFPNQVRLADLDQDGKLDIIVTATDSNLETSSAYNKLQVFHNNTTTSSSTISFDRNIYDVDGNRPVCLTTGDIDGDSKVDIVVVNSGSGSINRFYNNSTLGTISLSAPVADTMLHPSSNSSVVTTGASGYLVSAPVAAAIADLDGDGNTVYDIAVVHRGGNFVSIFHHYPVPVISPIVYGNDSFCIGAPITITSSRRGSSVGTWTVSDPAIATISAVGTGILDTAAVLTGITPGTVTVTFASSSLYDTSRVTQVFTVMPRAEAGILAGTTAVACIGTNDTVSSPSHGGTWSIASATIATITPLNDSQAVVTALTAGATEIYYSVTNFCGTDVDTITFNSNRLPNAGTVLDTVMCASSSITMVSSSPFTGYWMSTNTAVASVGAATGIVTATSTTGTTNIIFTDSTATCGLARDTAVVTVISTTVDPIVGATSVCQGATTTYTDATPGGTWSSTNTSVAAVGASTGIVTGVAGGTATISYSVNTSCGVRTASQVITVNPLPTADSVTGDTAICIGSTNTLTAHATNATSYAWSSSDATVASFVGSTTSTTASVNGVAGGTATITLIVTNACGSDTITQIVTVTPAPVVTATTGVDTLCIAGTTTLTNTTPGGTWSISPATGIASLSATTGSPVTVTGIAAGFATISYTVLGCVSSTDTMVVRVVPTPTFGTLSLTGPDTLCAGGTTTVVSTVAGGIFSTASTAFTVDATTGVVTANTPVIASLTDSVRYIVSNDCSSDTGYIHVSVRALPTVTSITGADSICATTSSTYATVGAIGGVGTWSVVTGGGSITALGAYTAPATSGLATIKYRIANACGADSVTKDIFIKAQPNAGTVNAVSDSVCAGLTNTFSVTGGDAGGTWTSSNTARAVIGTVTGSSVSVAVPTTASFGTVTISYTVSNSCNTVSSTKSMWVRTLPTIGATITGSTPICITRTSNFSTAIVNNGGSPISSYSWTSSSTTVTGLGTAINTATASTMPVTALAAGTATLTFNATNACGVTGDVTRTIAVLDTPDAGTITGPSVLCRLSTGFYYDSVVIPTGATATWSAFPAGPVTLVGSTSAPSINGFGAVLGSTVIRYRVAVSCFNGTSTVDLSDTAFLPVTVEPSPTTGTVTLFSGNDTICATTSAVLTSTNLGDYWLSADPSIATVDSASGTVTGVSEGTVTIYYMDTTASCGTDTSSFVMFVSGALPYAGFITGDTSICGMGTVVAYTDTVSGGVWSVTPTTIATINATGSLTTTGYGAATITYTVTNICGVNDTTLNIRVFANPTITNITPATVCDSIQFNFTPTPDSAGATMIWTRDPVFGIANPTASATGNISEYLDDTTNAAHVVTYVYVTSLNGCSSTQNLLVTVNPTPYITNLENDTLCSGLEYVFTPTFTTGAGTSFYWTRPAVTGVTPTTGSGNTSIAETLTSASLSSRVTVTYIDSAVLNGCYSIDSHKVSLDPVPAVPTITTHPPTGVELCQGTRYQNFGTATAPPTGTTYTWSTNPFSAFYAQDPTHQYALINFDSVGTTTVKVEAVITGFTCKTSDSFVVNVNSTPAPNPFVIYFAGQLQCLDNTVDSYQWGFDYKNNLDSELLINETNQFYMNSALDTDKYYWVIVTKGGCYNKIYYHTPTGINELPQNYGDVSVYPNPTTQYLSVDINNAKSGKYSVEVVNMIGQKILGEQVTNHKASLDVSNLASGVYMVDVYHNGVKFSTVKFVKN